MATYLRMPGVSADADEAVLGEWFVATGDAVSEGSALCAVETDKANVDVNAESDCVVFALLATAGDTVVVGDPIAVLLGEGDDDSAGQKLLSDLGGSAGAEAQPEPPAAEQPTVEPDSETAAAAAPAQGRTRVFSSPLARRLAAEAGLRIEDIPGTGPNGRVVRADVEKARASATQAPAPVPAPVAAVAPPSAPTHAADGRFVDTPHSKMRRAIASRLVESKATAPHFYLKASLDVDALLDLRAQINAPGDIKVSVNDLIVAAVAKALAAFPQMNVVWTDDAVRQFADVDVSVAIQTDRGLTTPVVRGADRLSLSELSSTISDLARRAGDNKLQASELTGGTMTVTNLGMFGIEEFAAIINPPQAAILAVGAATPTPVVRDGEVVVKNILKVVLSVDHRPVDGVMAARWLGVFKSFVEAPLRILV